jgi:hypothetical protein
MSEKINNPLTMPLHMADSHKKEAHSVSTLHNFSEILWIRERNFCIKYDPK